MLIGIFHIGKLCVYVPYLTSCCSETVWWILLKFAMFAPEQICLSVRPSVTFRCFIHMNTIVRSSASDRTIILVSGDVTFIGYSQGVIPSEGVKVKRLYIVSEN